MKFVKMHNVLFGSAAFKSHSLAVKKFKGQEFTFLLILAILVHAMLTVSVFDIYFKSPITHGIVEQLPLAPASAKRLVLVVADGLRIDKCFGSKLTNGEWAAPYIRHLAKKEGVWGRSQTRVPTESRPGHVAIIAGFYEDVSSVTTGWQDNPVDFDSVFNRSFMTWSWGSPDILHMFSKGAAASRVKTHCYDAREEDFADSNPSRLDTWVFDRFEEFLTKAVKNASVKSLLDQEKIIFFFHLLGMDTLGHSRKPASKEYQEGIHVVDQGLKKIVQLVENFYNNDGKTAYVLTADHGMTDWGSHGSSDIEETTTPLVIWGAGIRKPIFGKSEQWIDIYNDWGLQNVTAQDINQADLAPLMATLLGIPIPVNSVGVIPFQVLSGDLKHKALVVYDNARQIGAHFIRHFEDKKQNSFAIFFQSYLDTTETTIYERYGLISNFIKSGQTEMAMAVAQDLIEVCLNGLRYFQTYHRFSLSVTVLLGYIGWMIYLSLWLRDFYYNPSLTKKTENSSSYRLVFAVISFLLFILCYAQRYPLTYYFYNFITLFVWFSIYRRFETKNLDIKLILSNIKMRNIGIALFFLALVELLVIVFFERWFLCFPTLFLAFWPLTTQLYSKSKMTCLCWFITASVIATFPLFPPIGKDTNYHLVFISGFLVFATISIYLFKYYKLFEMKFNLKAALYVSIIQLYLLCFSTVNVFMVASYIEMKLPVPLMCRVLSWIIFGCSVFLPLFSTSKVNYRFINIGLSLITIYILFSFTYEALFFVILLMFLAQWAFIEYKLEKIRIQESQKNSIFGERSSLAFHDLRRVYISLLMLMIGYFGLGNVANVNSFTISSVYCFVTVFNPFLMAILLLWKLSIPFLAVASIVRAIQNLLHRPPSLLFWFILLLGDVILLNFFFLIRDEGSWLEIGSSIGRFVIASVISIAFFILYFISAMLTDVHWRFKFRKA